MADVVPPSFPPPSTSSAIPPNLATVSEPAAEPEVRTREPADVLCLGGIGLDVVVRTGGSFANAYLLSRPVLHLLVNPGISALVGGGALAAVGRVPLWQVLVAGIVGLTASDVFYWWAGRRYKHRIHRDLERLLRVSTHTVDRAEGLMRRRGGWILLVRYFQPVPNLVLQVLAGAGGMRLRTYLAASWAGGALWLGTLVWLGYVVGRPAVAVIDAASRNALKVTVVLVVVVIAWQRFRARRASGADTAVEPDSGQEGAAPSGR